MGEMIERVARALALVDEQNGAGSWEYYEAYAPKHLEFIREQARAAIVAMRKPLRLATDRVLSKEGDTGRNAYDNGVAHAALAIRTALE